MRFGFAEHGVQFLWNASDPAFSCATNALSFFFLAIEKMIVATVTEAMPLITDPQIAAEAEAFMRQEGQHSMAHRAHVKGLIKIHPALTDTLDALHTTYANLITSTSLQYRLAYIADLEATFTPSFTMLLDNADTLFATGDDDVASLFLWHFVEEIEHRSSALIIYNAVVAKPWYRIRVAPSVFKHATQALVAIAEDFNTHIPLEVRTVDARSMFGGLAWRKSLAQKLPRLQQHPLFNITDHGPIGKRYPHVRQREQIAAAIGVLLSQLPGHSPAQQKLPKFADDWLTRYDAGQDLTQWYRSNRQR